MFYVDIEKTLEDAFNTSCENEEMTRALFEKIHKSNYIFGKSEGCERFYDVQCTEAFKDLVEFVSTLTSDDVVRKNLLNNYAYFAVRIFPEETNYILKLFGDNIF